MDRYLQQISADGLLLIDLGFIGPSSNTTGPPAHRVVVVPSEDALAFLREDPRWHPLAATREVHILIVF